MTETGIAVRSVAAHPAGRRHAFDRPGGNAKIGDDAIGRAYDIGARKAALVLERAMTQPIIQGRFAAVERRQVVIGRQGNGRRKRGVIRFR